MAETSKDRATAVLETMRLEDDTTDAARLAQRILGRMPGLAHDIVAAWLADNLNFEQATCNDEKTEPRLSPARSVKTPGSSVVPKTSMSPAPRPNMPRVSPIALATANQRLATSILDTWVVNGVKFGDARVSDVNKFCDNRDRTTRMMRAVIKDLPADAIVRKVLSPQGAEERFKAARIELEKKPSIIEATQPSGYRHVSA